MSVLKPITIVGGGLAGLTLGIGLRQRGIPVTVWEAGGYPRHRVCGEFISGRGQDALVRLGLRELLVKAGAVLAPAAVFYQGHSCSRARPVNPPALCLSRFVMDALLAERLRACGGELRERSRWPGETSNEGVIRASGRRAAAMTGRWRWLGLKAHARGVALSAALELHGREDGYVGLCRLPGGQVNVCGLFRRSARAGASLGSSREKLRGSPGTPLHARLAGAAFDEDSFCAVAGLALEPARASTQVECCIGDALTMIPPVTGNGMSMAIEAAELAQEPLAAWSRGRVEWAEARKEIARACDRTFGQRLAWARWLQWLMFTPLAQGGIGALLLRSDWLWRSMFERTR